MKIESLKQINITPQKALVIATVLALLSCAISAYISMQQPWLGIMLAPSEGGLLVEEVDDSGPSAGILYAEDIIVEIADVQGNRIKLESRDIIEDPDAIPTFAERNLFRERQTRIHQILQQPIAIMTLEDRRVVRIQPQEYRPLLSFSISFWLLSLYAAAALLVGTAVWAVKQQSVPTKYLLLSGFGAIILLHSVKIITLRELALDGALYPWLTFGYHLGNNIFSLGMIGLVWLYPKNLGRFWIVLLLIAYMSFFMLNENFEWTELPGNSVLIQVPGYIIVGVTLMLLQWFGSRSNPLNRAAIKAILLMIWIFIIAVAGIYLTSVLLLQTPKITLNGSFFIMFTVYVLLSLSVIRFRLFDIDRWWFEIWLWFFAGIVIIVFDVMLVLFAGMASSYALGLSVLVAAWFYFPVRQWLWGKVFHRTQHGLEAYVPMLVRHFIQPEQGDTTKLWQKVMGDVFRPLSIESRQGSIIEARIVEDGIRMHVPCLLDGYCMELYYAEKGGRLFNSEDVELAQALFNISKSSMSQRESYTNGMFDERKRIMRDLHDDVGGRLLTLTHSEHDESATAAEALKSLREIIYSLDAEQRLTLNAAVAKWRIEALERCELVNIVFEWQWDETEEDIELSPRHLLNLTLILREALSNVFAHAAAGKVTFKLRAKAAKLHVHISNDGVDIPLNQMKSGKGLRNMRFRIEELGGEFNHICEKGTFCVVFSVPLLEEVNYA